MAARFAAAHPQVLLEAVVDDRKVDFRRKSFDAALRANPAPDGVLVGRLLGPNRVHLVAAPGLARNVEFPGALVHASPGRPS